MREGELQLQETLIIAYKECIQHLCIETCFDVKRHKEWNSSQHGTGKQ